LEGCIIIVEFEFEFAFFLPSDTVVLNRSFATQLPKRMIAVPKMLKKSLAGDFADTILRKFVHLQTK